MKKITLTLSLLIAISGWTVQRAHADLFSTGVPNPTDPSFNWRLSDASNLGRSAADDFILEIAGDVTNLHWYGSYLGNPSQPQPDNFTINFYNANGSLPAANPFHTATFTSVVTRQSTGLFKSDVSFGNVEIFEYAVNIATLPLAATTTYWVSIVNATTGITGWAWAYAPGGDSHASKLGASDPWETYGARNLAFSLNGAEVSTESRTWSGIKALYQ